MKRACVIGWPISQSRSPLIHGYWLRKYGIEGAYTKIPVEPANVGEFLGSLRERGFAGCNVTVPHKEAALQAAEHRDASALAVGAANTIWLEDGKIACANTDTYGFMTNLERTAPMWNDNPGAVVVLGAGGSARAIVYGFLQAGRKDIRVFNRSRERADALAAHFGSAVRAEDWDQRNDHVADAAVIVNTTTLGMNGLGELGINFERVQRHAVVADLVYVPLETSFLKQAREAGLTVVGGLGMLLHQAVPGFEKWFGVRPEVTDELYQIIAKDVEGS